MCTECVLYPVLTTHMTTACGSNNTSLFRCCVHFCSVGLLLLLDKIVDLSGTVGVVVSLVGFETKFKPDVEREIAQPVALLFQPFWSSKWVQGFQMPTFLTLLWFPNREHIPELALTYDTASHHESINIQLIS